LKSASNVPNPLLWMVFVLAMVTVAAGAWSAANFFQRQARLISGISFANGGNGTATQANRGEFRLPAPNIAADAFNVRPFDELARVTAKLAREQQLEVVQLQSEQIEVASRGLSHTRITLALRGDYVPSKSLIIALLSAFPGLTLEHLSVRHQVAGDPSLATSALTDAFHDLTIVTFIQYSGRQPDRP